MAAKLVHAWARPAFRRVAAWSACTASASYGMVNYLSEDTPQKRFMSCPTSSVFQLPLQGGMALCQSKLNDVGHVHFQNERLRVTEVKVQAGGSATVSFDFPHLRWEVLPAGPTPTPQPVFYNAGQSHMLTAKHSAGHREYVFEFLGPPKYTDCEFKEKQAAAWYHGSPGTSFMFENEYCVAWDFRVPGTGGDKHDMHQHTVDHFFVTLDLPCSLEVYVPVSFADLPAADRRVHNVKYAGKLDCPDVSTSWRYFGETGSGGFVDGKPAFGPAVHGVCNPNCSEFREYYVDLK
eukprot:TRINITY_DN36856_c0_g1_i1.p1 TRINITY_DN36856_c0_g1~~TRINITY_DN36856_c0_g1_i1.p1  ORF type:complete len:292 (-),score=44.66 TRINITY_DN36856_c0_g1_i1:59-934(-)